MFKRSILVITALVLVLGVASVSLGAPAFKIGVVTEELNVAGNR